MKEQSSHALKDSQEKEGRNESDGGKSLENIWLCLYEDVSQWNRFTLCTEESDKVALHNPASSKNGKYESDQS